MGKKKANSSSPSGPTRAIEALNKAGISFTLHEYEHSPEARTYGGETVEKLGVNPATTFKTLMVKLNTGEFVVGIIPVLHHLSMKLIAKAAGAKNAEMADPAVAQRRTGTWWAGFLRWDRRLRTVYLLMSPVWTMTR